jgi:S1-C subfamily serine protease
MHQPLLAANLMISFLTARFAWLFWIPLLLSSFSIAQQSLTPAQIAERAARSTVQIRAFDAQNRRIQSGTGFVISSNGTIVTNYHVVQGAHALQIEINSNEIYDNVYYVTSDPRRDLVVLRIFVENLHPLALGSDVDAAVGERIYVMGNPLGQINTFSDGIVSAKRTVEGVALLQITAPISSGSSGGPVMNARGEVIGVATMGVRGGENLNFSVPVRYVRPLMAGGDRPQRFTASILPPSPGGLIAPPATVGRSTATRLNIPTTIIRNGRVGPAGQFATEFHRLVHAFAKPIAFAFHRTRRFEPGCVSFLHRQLRRR